MTQQRCTVATSPSQAGGLSPRRSLTARPLHSGRQLLSQDHFVTVAVNGTGSLALPGTRNTCSQDARNNKKVIETHSAPDTVSAKSGPRQGIIASHTHTPSKQHRHRSGGHQSKQNTHGRSHPSAQAKTRAGAKRSAPAASSPTVRHCHSAGTNPVCVLAPPHRGTLYILLALIRSVCSRNADTHACTHPAPGYLPAAHACNGMAMAHTSRRRSG